MSERDPDDNLLLIFDRIAAGTHTEADLATLRRALLVGGQGKVIQIGKYNAYIGEGHDVRIGDTVYPDARAEAIKTALRTVLDEAGLQRRFGVPFQAPPLPAHFVPRPEVADALKSRLLTDAPDQPGVLVVSAIHGLGGIGKSTLASALCYSSEIQERFPDGFLWVALGERPQTLSHLHAWIGALGDRDYYPGTIDDATQHLRSMLHDKTCLMVVDDAWNADDVRPFLAGGSHCRVVITTRNATLGRKLGAASTDLDVMSAEQALDLFERRLGPLQDDRRMAAAVAHELGYLPLALELAAAQIQTGYLWSELLSFLKQRMVDLSRLDLDEASHRNESLRISFGLSLDHLSAEDLQAFELLGILPDEAVVTPQMASTLWEQRADEARSCLYRLRDRALLKEVATARYIIHDLLLDEARSRLSARMPLAVAHAELLKRYQARISGGPWRMLPDDGYIHANLLWHMEQAEWIYQIHGVLAEENADGRNGWYMTRDRLGQIAGYRGDIMRAWALAEQASQRAVEQGQPHFNLGWEVRYGLVSASINSLADRIPPALVVALVATRRWTPEKGLAYAREIPHMFRRLEALRGLGSVCQGPIKDQALGEEQSTRQRAIETDDRMRVLLGLSDHLPEIRQSDDLWATLRGFLSRQSGMGQTTEDVSEALRLLCSDLSPQLISQVVDWGRYHDQGSPNDVELATLLPRMIGSREFEQLLAQARDIKDPYWRSEAIAQLALHAPASDRVALLDEVSSVAEEIDDKELCTPLHLSLLTENALLGHPLEVTADELKYAISLVVDHKASGRVLEAMVSLAPITVLHDVLTWVREIPEKGGFLEQANPRAKVLVTLAPYLSEEVVLREYLDSAESVETSAAFLFGYRCPRGDVLQAVMPSLQGPLAVRALHLVASLPPELPSRRWTKPDSFLAFSPCADALIKLASHIPPSSSNVAYGIAQKLPVGPTISGSPRMKALLAILPFVESFLQNPVAQEVYDLAITTASLFGDLGLGSSVAVLAELSSHFGQPTRKVILDGARMFFNEIAEARTKAEAAVALAPHLETSDRVGALAAAIDAAGTVEDDRWRLETVAALLSYLDAQTQQIALARAMASIEALTDKNVQAQCIAKLYPHLPRFYRAKVFSIITDTVKKMDRGPQGQASYLDALAVCLTDSQLCQLLKLVKFTDMPFSGIESAMNLTSRLARMPARYTYPFWRDKMHALAQGKRAPMLAELTVLAPLTAGIGGHDTIVETMGAIGDVMRWWP